MPKLTITYQDENGKEVAVDATLSPGELTARPSNEIVNRYILPALSALRENARS